MSGHPPQASYRAWLAATRARLAPIIGPEDAAREARLILAHVTGQSSARLSVAGDDPLPRAQCDRADAMVTRRIAREPLAQILGQWAFYGRDFTVTRATLTPRPDTETLIDLALAAPWGRVLDLGTGTGAIAVTLLAERARATGLASDISPEALAVARHNALRHDVAQRLGFVQADWWDGIAAAPSGRFDLIVSNPPYVTEAEYDELAPEITRWEPRGALTPGGDGLAPYRVISAGLAAHLAPGGLCLVEIGAGQGAAVAGLFAAAGLEEVAVHADINGKPRIVAGRSPKGGIGA